MKKVCVITGASGVLCSAFATELAKNGMAVALLNRTPETGRALADRINAAGGTARSYAVSVLDKAALEAVHEKILADYKGVFKNEKSHSFLSALPSPRRG